MCLFYSYYHYHACIENKDYIYFKTPTLSVTPTAAYHDDAGIHRKIRRIFLHRSAM